MFAPPSQIFTATNTMTAAGRTYTLTNAHWSDREAWAQMVWTYGPYAGMEAEEKRRAFGVLFHASLGALSPLPEGANAWCLARLTIDSTLAGFVQVFYSRSLDDRLHATGAYMALTEPYQGKGHFKYLFALAAWITAHRNYPLHITVPHGAVAIRKTLTSIRGIRHIETTRPDNAPAGDDKTDWVHDFVSDPAVLKAAIEADKRFGEITYQATQTPLSDPRWASPEVKAVLSPSEPPSVSEGFSATQPPAT